jgi:hypothetical protein
MHKDGLCEAHADVSEHHTDSGESLRSVQQPIAQGNRWSWGGCFVFCPFSEAWTARCAFVWTRIGARRAAQGGAHRAHVAQSATNILPIIREPGRQSYDTQRHKMAIHASMRLADELNPCHPDANWYGRGAHRTNRPKALLAIRRSARRNKEG